MKLVKKVFTVILILMLIACNKNDDNNSFLLNNQNLAGIHLLNFLAANIETTVVVEGIPVTAYTTVTGDTFQVEADFKENGTYTIEGEYRIEISVTVGGITETSTEIIVLNENGTYQIDTNEQTITIVGAEDLVDGTFEVTLFNEDELRMVKEETITDNDSTTESILEIRFIRQ